MALGDGAAGRAAHLARVLGNEMQTRPAAPGTVDALDALGRYAAQFAMLRDRIRAGDLFQANISRRFVGKLPAGDHPYDLFGRLCAHSPAPFGAYLKLADKAVVSNSPERFVAVRRDGDWLRAETKPIKGTRPRGAAFDKDEALRNALAASEKDRAENLMIVDLMRNDLARVSQPGTVRAPSLFAIESFANVHHLVSTVTSTLAPGRDAFDLWQAAFPAGSITGAPKIKAMEVIDGFEQAPRGASYGSIAWFGADGAMDSSVLIRTAACVQAGDRWDVAFRVGGGVTIDSDPEEEARETEHKARALLRAIREPDR
jgi:para-aminobenzoate synthetase component I